MTRQPPKAYIFDMDGTLVGNCAYHVTAWREFSKAHGNEIPEKDLLAWMGAKGAFFVEKIVGKELPPDEVARLCEEKEAIYRSIYKPVLPDGLREWLDYAHARKIPCALATGGPKANVDFILDSLNLRGDFAVIVDGSMYTHSKPDPECFLKAAELMGVEPPLCRVYEDAVNGIGAAKAAGMSVVAITFTNPREVLEEAGATRVIDSYRDLSIWPVKQERTAEDDAAIAYLDKLRACADEPPPVVPLACVVKVTAVEDVPKAGERYAMATVEEEVKSKSEKGKSEESGRSGNTWRVCVKRGVVQVGDDALFVTPDVAFPDEERFRENFHVMPRVYKYGFGVSERVLQPHLARNIYHNNPGLLCPIARFKELRPGMTEIAVMRFLKIQKIADLKERAQPKPKTKNVFQPGVTVKKVGTKVQVRVKKGPKKPMPKFEKPYRPRERFDTGMRNSGRFGSTF